MSGARSTHQTATHWGTYRAEVQDGRVVARHPVGHDRDPSPIGHSVASTVQGPLRIAEPMVREGWLERRHRSDTMRRGAEPFVPVPARDIRDADVVRLFNDRGQCLAGAVVTDRVVQGVVVLPIGVWYDPLESGAHGTPDVHGTPNAPTLDKGTSRLAQGPSAHSCLVEIERLPGAPPPVRVFEPPPIRRRND